MQRVAQPASGSRYASRDAVDLWRLLAVANAAGVRSQTGRQARHLPRRRVFWTGSSTTLS
jgi:hypothetical protein